MFRFAFALVVIAAILFFGGNAIVTSGLLMRLINNSTDEVQVRYSSASGTLLTDFRFKDLEVDGEDSNVKWQVRVREAALIVPIYKLPSKIFETSKLEGHGFSFHLDFKPKKPKGPPDPESYKRKWRIRLGGIRLDEMKKVEIGDYTLPDGPNTSLEASFYFWPERELRIDPSHFRINNLQRQIDLKFDLAQFRFKDRPGVTFFRDLSAELRAKTENSDVRYINYYFKAVPFLKVKAGNTQMDAWIRVKKGVVDPESRGQLDFQQLQLKLGEHRVTGVGQLKLRKLALELHLKNYRLDALPVSGKKLHVLIDADKIELEEPLAHAKWIDASLKQVTGQLLDSTIRGDVRLKTHVDGIISGHDTVELSGLNVRLSDFQLSNLSNPKDLEIQNWWGTLFISDGTIRSGPKMKYAGKARFFALNGKPILAALQNMGKLPINLSGIIPMRDLQATADFNYDHDGLRIFDIRVYSSTLKADGNLRIQDGQRFGKLNVDLPPFSFDVSFAGEKSEFNRH